VEGAPGVTLLGGAPSTEYQERTDREIPVFVATRK
jgi:hypothetical protein